MSDQRTTTTTKEQQDALNAYWAATSPTEERVAYERMMASGLPDSYAATDRTETTASALPYMHPEKYVPMPAEASELLRLADILCGVACEHSNQQEPAEPWDDVPFNRSPVWSYEALSKALNAYWNARHGI